MSKIGIILTYPFYGLGWLVGFIVKIARLTWSAVAEGFEAGNKL